MGIIMKITALKTYKWSHKGIISSYEHQKSYDVSAHDGEAMILHGYAKKGDAAEKPKAVEKKAAKTDKKENKAVLSAKENKKAE